MKHAIKPLIILASVVLATVPPAQADPLRDVDGPGTDPVEWLVGRVVEYASGLDPNATVEEHANNTADLVEDILDFVEEVGACILFEVTMRPQIHIDTSDLEFRKVTVEFPGFGQDSKTGAFGFGQYEVRLDANIELGCTPFVLPGPDRNPVEDTEAMDLASAVGEEVEPWTRTGFSSPVWLHS